MKYRCVPYDSLSLLGTESRATVTRTWNEYLYWGGLPESVNLTVKRSYLSSTFQKIYLGDICSRNKIANPLLLQLMLKKLAESVCQPVSYNRLSHVLSSVSGKITMLTVSKYIEYCEQAWLLLRLRNVSAPFAEKETACKYYFVDNERVFFYNDKVEVDFYVPEDELAIQVSYSMVQSQETFDREVNALKKLPNVLPCRKRFVLTNDETGQVEDSYGTIDIIPVWKWLLTWRKGLFIDQL